jgi:biopolymer transport protein ExbD
MRKKFRFLTILAVCVMVLSCFSVTAFAYADDTEQNLPVTEATQPEQQPETTPAPEKPMGEPIDDEGNAYTRDLLYDKATNKQFITVQTKNGNTFFIVIDYDAPINEDEEQYQTYFLNMVDESDLLTLLDDDTAAALTTCNCKEKCAAGQVNTDCPVCKTNMSECTGTEPVHETPTEDEPPVTEEPKQSSNMGMIIAIVAIAGIGGAAYYYFKFIKGKKQKDDDMDFFDDEGYEEEPYINEDREPEIADDEETEGDD